MKTLYLYFLALLTLFSVPALADQPNRAAMGFKQWVEASGCVFVDQGGYSTIEAATGGFCPAMKGYITSGTFKATIDPDGIPGNGDETTETRRDG